MDKGQRVGAILKADEKEIHLLGYGIYEGNQIPPDGFAYELGLPNPKITLDDGRIVWGYQCWWGPEEEVRELINGRTVIPATI